MKQKTHERYLQELEERNVKIRPLERYRGSVTKIKHECMVCGYQWDIVPSVVLTRSVCPKCSFKNISMSAEEFAERVNNLEGDIELLEPYKSLCDRIWCKCNNCGNTWHPKGTVLIYSKYGCGKCAHKANGNKARATHEEFLEKLSKVNPFITPLEKYVTNRTNIMCRCNKCGYEWQVKPNNLLNGWGCPMCHVSSGEKQVACYLVEHKISYIYEYSFDGLVGVGGGLLSYDFYIPTLNTLIEYQGEQHYHPVDSFGGVERFEIQQEHDKRKRDYALQHGIRLIEIKYDEDVNEILDKVLKFESVTTAMEPIAI